MVFSINRGKVGTYRYFSCTGKPDKLCDEPYLRAGTVEDAVVTFLRQSVRLDPDEVAHVRAILREVLESEQSSTAALHQHLAKLDKQEGNSIDLAADGAMANKKIKARLLQIDREREAIRDRLEHRPSNPGVPVRRHTRTNRHRTHRSGLLRMWEH